ncbi:MAG: OmpA family protein [Polyangiaceae bacterium]|jgi:peptidoglycan-associated lipoprotein
MNAIKICVVGAFALSVVGAVLIGCGGEQPAAKTPVAVAPPPPPAPQPRLPVEAPSSPTVSAVHISEEITRTCGIAEPDAFFAFDSANVRPDDKRVLEQVVTCFSTGPLKGRTLRLVGHADPRGGSDYNMTLGQSRADAVAHYIVERGLDKSKAESSSRGAMDAVGSDEPSWAHDRRVDLLLAQ